MKKLMTAVFVAGTMVFGAAALVVTPVVAQEEASLQSLEEFVEQMLVENADDPAAFEEAIANFVAGSADPELANEAVINALTNPKSDAAKIAVQNNTALKEAGARGLGRAIAIVGVTNPTAAANMQAQIEASNDTTLVSSANEANATQTASIRSSTGGDEGAGQQEDSTPETPVSPN
ncbi:hypothetical protein [Parvibaculum sp.]|uniref:hypothetical protein n=1 Tax=Parvibaculum sp. TaxID=2024848 RepID=UPI001B2C077D|nr:hypothetical protein [Parvibaculum sp.]MBO6668064.1 hypothetical protein [Parvibaculum sp.]MBO6692038.1 hypothetical protein [Parvibaculum sp.]MBO6715620.1 hypothetical protein [Parvibaculum sp.]